MDKTQKFITGIGCLVFIGIAICSGLIVVALALAGIIEFTNPGGEKTKPIPNSDEKIVVPSYDHALDAFRAEWDIYGRFETWPALLPLAQLSEIAYEDSVVVEQKAQSLGFEKCITVSSPFHTQVAYLVSGGDVAVIVFRGTDDTEDWLTNANIYLHQLRIGEIHTGFSGAYGMVQTRIVEEVAKMKPKHLWATGHSLGGAMALVCAVDMIEFQNRNINGVITFGQPKIGREMLTTNLQGRIGDRYVHFANERDAVPFLPQTFSHCGLLLRFFKGKVQKSSNYFPVGATAIDPFSDEIEYEPIDNLPEIDPLLYEQYKKSKVEKNRVMMEEEPFGLEPSDEQVPPVVGAIPWKDDHSMTLYVEKIQKSIDQARGVAVDPFAEQTMNQK